MGVFDHIGHLDLGGGIDIFLPLLWAVYDFGHQQGKLFVFVVVLNNNTVCGFGGGVNHNFWFGIFLLLWIFNLTDWTGCEND